MMMNFCPHKTNSNWGAVKRSGRCAALFLASMLLLPGSAVSQGTGSVTGRVASASDLASLAGVQILVEGTGIGAISNNTGRFLLLNVPAGEVVVSATMLGRLTV